MKHLILNDQYHYSRIIRFVQELLRVLRRSLFGIKVCGYLCFQFKTAHYANSKHERMQFDTEQKIHIINTNFHRNFTFLEK